MAEGGSFFGQQVGEPSRRAFLDVDKRVKAAQDDAASALAQIAALSPDHGSLLGLGDDDHPQYAFRNSSPTITLAGDASGSVTLTNLGSGTLTVAVNDDSHSHSAYLPLSGGTMTADLYISSGSSTNAFRGGLNYWRPQDAYGNSYFAINSGSFYVDSANYYFRNASSVNSLTLDSSGNGVLTGHFTANHYYSTSNGAGTNYRLGDDCWIGDVNVANTTRLTGVQNSDRAYIQFGNSGNKLGQAGTGSLTWEGSFWLNGITLSNISSSYGSMRISGSQGYIDVGPKNSSWCHIYTDRPEFYFNKEIRINNVRVSKEGHTHSYYSTGSSVRALYYNGYGNSEITAYQTSGNWQTWTGGWATHIIGNHGNGSNYYNQTLIMPFWGGPYYMRKQGGGNVGPYLIYTSEHVNKSSADWNARRLQLFYGAGSAWSSATLELDTANSSASISFHTGGVAPQFRVGHNYSAVYLRNSADSGWSTLIGVISNQSSRKDKQDISDFRNVPSSLSSDADVAYGRYGLELVKKLRPVSYRWQRDKHLDQIPLSERRAKALARLQTFRENRGLEPFVNDELFHLCGRDCDGSEQQPCARVRDWQNGSFGFIAEEVGEVAPELGTLDSEGNFSSIDNVGLTAVAVAAIQELSAKVESLEAQLEGAS